MANKRMQHFGIFLLLIVVAISYFYNQNQNRPDVPADLVYKTIDGRSITLEQLRGKTVLVDFWSTSCKSCIKEMPDLIALHKEFSSKGLEIIGVAMPYDRPDMVLKAAEDLQIPYPVALDIDGEIIRAYGNVSVTPTHFLIAPDGKILDKIVGKIDMVKFRDRIKTMLHKNMI